MVRLVQKLIFLFDFDFFLVSLYIDSDKSFTFDATVPVCAGPG